MLTSTADLSQFKLDGKIGEGADSEVFAATDSATGDAVVVKRPHPMLIARGQHSAVERRMASAIALRERLGDTLPCVAKMIGYSPPACHDEYFGDALGEPYSVVVEERARGIPLVASAMDGIKRHPIGLPQNLFAIHPVMPHLERGQVQHLARLAGSWQGIRQRRRAHTRHAPAKYLLPSGQRDDNRHRHRRRNGATGGKR